MITLNIFITTTIASTEDNSTKIYRDNGSYWSKGKSMPTARGEFGAVLLKDRIYTIGGVDYQPGGGKKNIVEVYDIAKNQWIDGVAPLPVPLDHFASGVYGNKIYVVGGFLENKVPTDRVFIYDPEQDVWKGGKSLPSPRGALKAEFIDGILYAVGGLNSSQVPVNTIYAFDPATNTWTIKAPMLTPRQHFATATLDGKLYVMGGRILGDGVPSEALDETLTNFNRVEVYDPNTNSWNEVQPMLTKRSGFAAASVNGSIFVFGGLKVIGATNTVERYDPIKDMWMYDKPLSIDRFALSAVAFDSKIYVLGGQRFEKSDLISSNINEIFHVRYKK